MRRSVGFLGKNSHHVLQGRGIGIFGALGSGCFEDKYSFDEIDLYGREAIAVSAGIGHTAIITKEKQVAIFGRAFDLASIFKIYGMYRILPFLAIWSSKLTLLDNKPDVREILLSPMFLDELVNQKAHSVSCSGGLTAILTESGKVYCVGANNYGQCGLGEERNRFWRPITNVSLPFVSAVDTGLQHCVALCENGEVYCWGKGKNGQIGSGIESEKYLSPYLCPILKKCIAISSGLNHSVALDEFGTLYLWGKRMSLELVPGNKYTYKDQLKPRSINLPNNLQITSVSCSSFSTVVTASDGSLWVMGLDEGNDTVSVEFQQVLNPFDYQSPENSNKTDLELANQEDAQQFYQLADGDCLKKGYYSVALITACRQKVYDVVLRNGIARLQEIRLDYRREGKIVDFTMGFRHCMVITEIESHER